MHYHRYHTTHNSSHIPCLVSTTLQSRKRKHTLPSPLKEKPHHENLQSRHRNHHQPLNNAKVENPPLRAAHRAEIPVFARPEVLLVPADRGQLRRELEDGLVERVRLFGGRALARGELGALFVFDLCRPSVWILSPIREAGRGRYSNLKIDQLLGKRRHLVIEAESVLAQLLRSEDKVALPLLLPVHDDLLAGSDDGVVDIK